MFESICSKMKIWSWQRFSNSLRKYPWVFPISNGMKKYFFAFFLLIFAVCAFLVVRYSDLIQGALPAFLEPSERIEELIGKGELPLTLPPGFSVSLFANVSDARVMVFDENGDMWISQTSAGTITRLTVENGAVVAQNIIFNGLNKPHGLAFDPRNSSILYIAEENRVSRVNVSTKEKTLEEVLVLPHGEGHFTRTIGFGPDGRLYISIGSSCNVCDETEEWRGTILSLGKSATDLKIFARGLRNAVFFTWSYIDGKMWATEMGRDNLGDDLPPDEINIIENPSTSSGQNSIPNFGWPICYGKNIHDTNFDKNVYVRDPCADKIPSHVDLQAHSAPLGLAFIPEEGWPEDYWHNLFVAYHGSWNRSEPTGYKVIRIKLDDKGNYLEMEDFITGWLTKNGALGRPVDILVQTGGIMYVTDDKAGVIYKVTYKLE